MIYHKTYLLENIEDIKSLVKNTLEDLGQIKVICLRGELGAGKTTISKEFIKALTGIETVTSPTFNIVQIYEGKNNKVFHYDLYRVKNEVELYEIGLLENMDNGYSFIEWPEIAENYLNSVKKINISIIIVSESKRRISVSCVNEIIN